MSMNISEFKSLLGADPWSRNADTRQARKSSAECEAVAREAEAFENKLQGALRIDAPVEMLDDIKGIAKRRRNWVPLALAASLLVAVGAVVLNWKLTRQWDTVQDYLADHYAYDGASLVAEAAGEANAVEIRRVLASLSAVAKPPLAGKIRVIKLCPTPDGRGAHMVVDSGHGLVTVILMPNTRVEDGESIDFDNTHALLVNLDQGSAAIIGAAGQALEDVHEQLHQSLVVDDVTA